jgi:hypothetical protein
MNCFVIGITVLVTQDWNIYLGIAVVIKAKAVIVVTVECRVR